MNRAIRANLARELHECPGEAMTHVQSRPMLRLVTDAAAPAARLLHSGIPAAPPSPQASSAAASSAARIRSENRAAAWLSPLDARWIVALRASQYLEGGRAAILTPEHRQRVVRLATSLGLRPFDAHLVIAIIQDSARTGDGPLAPAAVDRLTLVRGATDNVVRAPMRAWVPAMIAAVGAIGLFSLLVNWVAGR
ncbi:MAG: hypothetical protein KF745_01280 [Phycisphaeraceae bacterium]|nr:hypothetical protein [Phycisphaeraceae bacterium]